MYEFINEKEIENIMLEHVVNNKKIEDKARELIKHVFEQLSSRILLQIKLHLENANRYKVVERRYEMIRMIKQKYSNYVSLHVDSSSLNPNDFATISNVQYRIEQEIQELPTSKDNPIEYERTLIVSTGLLRIKESMNKLEEECIFEFNLPNGYAYDVSSFINEYLEGKYDTIQQLIYELVNDIVDRMNDENQRSSIQQFKQLLEQQVGVIENFLNINLEIDVNTNIKSENHTLTETFIYPLRQIYQELQAVLRDISQTSDVSVSKAIFELKNISEMIENNVQKERRLKELIELIEGDKTNTLDRLIIHVNDELKKAAMNELRGIKKKSARFELLSYIIVDMLQRSMDELKKLEFAIEDTSSFKSIGKGVYDTIVLKLSSLKEKDAVYHMNKLDDYLEYENKFLIFKQEFEQLSDFLLEDAICGSRTSFMKIQDKFTYLVDKEMEQNFNRDIDYFTKEVLFEMRTFEDLLQHSISKLTESEDESVLAFAKGVSELYDKMINVLKEYEFIRIIPKPGDVFNGKIHEAVFAQMSDVYKKGEVIQCQNCGFIYQNQMLVRASVIAAK